MTKVAQDTAGQQLSGPAGQVAQAAIGRDPLLPAAQGLYDPAKEHDACGVGFVANMHNQKSHEIVEMGLQILLNLDHRPVADSRQDVACRINPYRRKRSHESIGPIRI